MLLVGRFPASNEAAAVLNVIKFRGVVAFVNAVMRGLTTEEREKVRAVLVQPHLPNRLSDKEKERLDGVLAEIKALSNQSTTVASEKMVQVWKSLQVDEKLYVVLL